MHDVERIIFIMEEISILKGKLQPQDTGHINTAISVLERRVEELKNQVCQKP